ncbi:MAG: ATP-binding protein [Deltaproteobacteria bacterium]|nr:ATP-binding protein [Deltaproteobacteria bacterium]
MPTALPTDDPTLATPTPFDDTVAHVQCELDYVRALLRRHLERRGERATGNGLQVSADELAEVVQGHGWLDHPSADAFLRTADAAIVARCQFTVEAGRDLPLHRIAEALALQPAERDALRLLLAPEVDVAFERAFAAVWDDLSRKCADIGFVADMVATEPRHRLEVASMLGPGGALVRAGVVELAPLGPPPHGGLQGRQVRLARRVALAALGDPTPDERLPVATCIAAPRAQPQDFLCDEPPRTELIAELVRTLSACNGRAALTGQAGCGRALLTEIAVQQALPGHRLLLVEVAAGAQGEALATLLAGVQLEALVSRAVPVLRLCELPDAAWMDQVLAGLQDAPGPVVVLVPTGAPQAWNGWRPLHVPAPEREVRVQLWRRALQRAGGDVAWADELATRSNANGGGIQRAVRQAQQCCARPQLADLWRAALAQQNRSLGDGATAMHTTLGWRDVVLPAEVRERLDEVAMFVRGRKTVLEDWGFADKLPYGRGISVLLHGPSGTGKTMVAGLVAAEIGRPLYRVDLSRVLSKWIGETERNLARLFDEAQSQGAVLLFDEADSLFAKRTEVKSSNDRHANLEVNYLLQKMEEFDGVSILTTNFEGALDEAFKRRLRFRIAFPFPDAEARAELWHAMLPAKAQVASDIDFVELGREFDLSGGHIKNAVVRAAYQAAHRGGWIEESDLRAAALQECRELGKPVRAFSADL